MSKKPYLQASGPEWERQRIFCMARDGCLCQAHKFGVADAPCTENRPRYLIVHHIKRRIDGGTHVLDNLITLCRVHHGLVHPHLRYGDDSGSDSGYAWREP